ncbi:MAG: response regulator [Polaromonas sp.]|uniref:response regulator n=1 Tax=Polaromonas sp. TaxID=1869339 RepID=UPI002735EC4E|nr:response regulator [Polaromonas sp.]MDP3798845.1 response regulator [Polaromonas sp.]
MHPDLPQSEGPVNQRLEPVVMHALQRFRALLPGEVELAVELAHEHPQVRAYADRLERALLSVFIVAWHSMVGQATQIVVEMSEVLLDDVVLDPDAGKLQGGLPPRRYVRLIVSNSSRVTTGPSHRLMPAPTQIDDRPSSARRLPLVEISKIIAQHHGMITASPEPGRGTAFDIYLPTALPLETPAVNAPGSGLKHIVYVDDYEAMRNLVSEALPDAGFRVTCYASGRDALPALHADPSGCDAVVTDYRLQGYSGIELLKQIKRLRADLPVIIMSGYVDDTLRAAAHDAGAALVMSKAHDLSELCIALRELFGDLPHPDLVTYSGWSKL